MKFLFSIILSWVTLSSLMAQDQDQVEQLNLPALPATSVFFLDGYKVDSVALSKLALADIHSVEFKWPYGYPSGALYIHTNDFITTLRPEFYRNLQRWLKNKPGKVFILDGMPLIEKKMLLFIAEADIDGFQCTNVNGKELVEIILVPNYGINYR